MFLHPAVFTSMRYSVVPASSKLAITVMGANKMVQAAKRKVKVVDTLVGAADKWAESEVAYMDFEVVILE